MTSHNVALASSLWRLSWCRSRHTWRWEARRNVFCTYSSFVVVGGKRLFSLFLGRPLPKSDTPHPRKKIYDRVHTPSVLDFFWGAKKASVFCVFFLVFFSTLFCFSSLIMINKATLFFCFLAKRKKRKKVCSINLRKKKKNSSRQRNWKEKKNRWLEWRLEDL